MNKILNISVVILLLGSSIPIAYANGSENSLNDSVIDKETQQQIEIMNYSLGSEIRLLQLEKAIVRNIERGEKILNFTAKHGVNINDLELILEELSLLKQEVQLADPNASDAVMTFVDLKHDAVNLTRAFREQIHTLVNTTSLDLLQIRIQNMTCNQTQNISNSIRRKIRQFNTNQFRRFYQILGENDIYFLNQYKNGSLSLNNLKENIKEKINQDEKAKQFNLLASMKQEKIHSKIKAQRQAQNASEGFQKRMQNRLEKRIQRLENLSGNNLQQGLMKRIQNKLDTLDDIRNDDKPGAGESTDKKYQNTDGKGNRENNHDVLFNESNGKGKGGGIK